MKSKPSDTRNGYSFWSPNPRSASTVARFVHAGRSFANWRQQIVFVSLRHPLMVDFLTVFHNKGVGPSAAK